MAKLISMFFVLIFLQAFLFRRSLCGPVKVDEKLSAEKIVVIRQVGEKLKENINPDVNPCVDYYSYICSNYTASSEIVQPKLKNFADFQRNYKNTLTAKFFIKIRNLLPTCQERAEKEFLQFLRKFNFADSIGGWPAFDSSWTGEKFNLDSAIADMRSYLVPVVINTTFVEEELSMKRYLSVKLVIEPFLDEESSKEEMVQVLLRHGLNNADQIVNQCVDFESNFLRNASKFRQEKSDEDVIETDYKGLMAVLSEIDWNSQLSIILGRTLNDSYPVVIHNPEDIRSTFKNISDARPESVANYFFCHFLKKSVKVKKGLSNEYDCVHNALIFSTKDLLQEIFAKIFSQNNNSLAKQEIVELIYSTAAVLNETLGIFGDITLDNIETEAEKLIHDSSLLDVKLKEGDTTTILQNEFYLTREAERRFMGYFIGKREEKMELAYVMSLSSLIFYSLFGQHLPSATLFNALIENIINVAVVSTKEPEDFSDSIRSCFQRQMHPEQIQNRYLLEALMAQIYFRTFFHWASNHRDIIQAEDEILMEYGLTNRELIFEDFMRGSCEDRKGLALVYLQNLKEFSDVYNCPIGSPMNPVEKCKML